MLNYPVKYGLMPITKEVGMVLESNEIHKVYKTVFYIPSMCYVLSEKVRYYENGTKDGSYEVVFPYQEDNLDSEKNIPEYDDEGKCLNSMVINGIFNTYEEAKNWADSINKKIIENEVIKMYLRSGNDFKQIKKLVSANYESYYTLSLLIKNATDSIKKEVGDLKR